MRAMELSLDDGPGPGPDTMCAMDVYESVCRGRAQDPLQTASFIAHTKKHLRNLHGIGLTEANGGPQVHWNAGINPALKSSSARQKRLPKQLAKVL